MYEHSGSGNHGCEAIIRGTNKIINSESNEIVLISKNPDEDIKYGLSEIIHKIYYDLSKDVKKYTWQWFVAKAQTKLTGRVDWQIYLSKKSIFDKIDSNDVVLFVGGDNYCYSGTEILATNHKVISNKDAKTILWGCSIDPNVLQNPKIQKDIANYDVIIARESITFNNLSKFNKNTFLYPDPAFILPVKKKQIPFKTECDIVGINCSPLILEESNNQDLVLLAFKNLIRYILQETDYNIALIPHVVWDHSDDRKTLSKLLEDFENDERVCITPDGSAEVIKGYISQCRFMVAARTHASIAAYSLNIPCLVVGYSIKSKGLAIDLFGTDNNYVLPVKNIVSSDDITNKFIWLMDNEIEIRERLQIIIPKFQERLDELRTDFLILGTQ